MQRMPLIGCAEGEESLWKQDIDGDEFDDDDDDDDATVARETDLHRQDRRCNLNTQT